MYHTTSWYATYVIHSFFDYDMVSIIQYSSSPRKNKLLRSLHMGHVVTFLLKYSRMLNPASK